MQTGWATCPITENRFFRIVSSPSYANLTYANLTLSFAAISAGFTSFLEANRDHHQFWADSVSIFDPGIFDPRKINGHKQISDLYLLALCQKNGGRLVTFDAGTIQTLHALIGASKDMVLRLNTLSFYTA